MTFGSSQLAAVSKRAAELCLYALRVLQDGETVLALGDQTGPVSVHSIRKSFLSALFGQVIARGVPALDGRIGDLGNIYERTTGKSMFLALDHELAKPLGLHDWDPYRDSRYEYKNDFFGGNTRLDLLLRSQAIPPDGPLVVVITGPAGVGKTAFAVK
jgi:hypothetical protein